MKQTKISLTIKFTVTKQGHISNYTALDFNRYLYNPNCKNLKIDDFKVDKIDHNEVEAPWTAALAQINFKGGLPPRGL